MSTFLTDTVDVLRRTPAVVSALLAGVPNTWTETPDTAEGWRPRDVVGHLISAEIDDWIPRAERILQDGTSKPFEPFDRFARAVHDLDHVSQIFAGMAGSQDADVGPWKTYLGILLRRDDPAASPG